MRAVRAALAMALAGAPLTSISAEALLLGVGTHFGQSRSDLGQFESWMTASQFTSARDEMYWSQVEDEHGRFVVRGGAAKTRESWQRQAKLEPLLVLSYGNKRFDGGGQPISESGIDAFARYAVSVTQEMRARVGMVEVWNEWNLGAGSRPGGSRADPVAYARLASRTFRALKTSAPSVKVLVGGMGEDFPNWRWTRAAIDAGLLSAADGLSVHLYNYCAGKAVGSDELAARADALRGILDQSGYPTMPIYVTEVGWPTHSGKCGVSEMDAAVHSIRFLLEASRREWIAGVWYYELADGGHDDREREQRFGLIRPDGSEKPAGCVLRQLGAAVARRPVAVSTNDEANVAVFSSDGGSFLIVWARQAQARPMLDVELRSSNAWGSVTGEFVCGAIESQVEQGLPGGKSIRVRLSGTKPALIRLNKPVRDISIWAVQ